MKTKFFRGCDAFVVPGKSSIDYLRNYGVHQDRIFVAPNAVDTLFFAQRAELIRKNATMHREALDLPSRFFLFVGRLVQGKGVLDLLNAYEALPPEIRKEIGLVFAGDGAARPALQQRAASVGPGRIHLAGFAQKEDLASYYALAEVLVLPTYTDPWGLVVNEAMACGLPVIASNAAGCVADLIENGWNGLVIPSGEIGRLTLAMNELARDGLLRSLMGKRSTQRIAQYSPEAWAAGMAQLPCLKRGHAA
jgi:glycosyltransferase involved in cell wall biosynthesis